MNSSLSGDSPDRFARQKHLKFAHVREPYINRVVPSVLVLGLECATHLAEGGSKARASVPK